jgi:hypothetical protein
MSQQNSSHEQSKNDSLDDYRKATGEQQTTNVGHR